MKAKLEALAEKVYELDGYHIMLHQQSRNTRNPRFGISAVAGYEAYGTVGIADGPEIAKVEDLPGMKCWP